VKGVELMTRQEGTEEKGQENGKTETRQKNTKYIDRDTRWLLTINLWLKKSIHPMS